jgi:hypothetical protein
MKLCINFDKKYKLLSLFNSNKKELDCILQRNVKGNFNVIFDNEIIGFLNDKNEVERFIKIRLVLNDTCERFFNNILLEVV